MPQENIIAVILFHFCTICEVQNADNTITFKISSDNKLSEVYATTSCVSTGNTTTCRITSNYCYLSCSAVYGNKTILKLITK